MKEERKLRILLEIYRELFALAEPKSNWAEIEVKLKDNRPDNAFYLDYTMKQSDFYETVERVLKRNRVTQRYLKRQFEVTALLGASPKFK